MRLSLHDFSTGWGAALSFSAGDEFVVFDTTRDPHWWLALSSEGEVGYVPANYLAPNEVRVCFI